MLTVITQTRGERPELLERAVRSVQLALPPGAEHKIIQSENWAEARLRAACEHELVAFVDDDDVVHQTALTRCLDALSKGLGAACTQEFENDRPVLGVKTYEGAAIHPRVVHHLFMFRGEHVDPAALTLHRRFGVGIDWFIRSSVVLRHGCWSIPEPLYTWSRHDGQHTNETQQLYSRSMPAMSQEIRRRWYGQLRGRMPIVTDPGVVTV